jgi:hypothetical protein
MSSSPSLSDNEQLGAPLIMDLLDADKKERPVNIPQLTPLLLNTKISSPQKEHPLSPVWQTVQKRKLSDRPPKKNGEKVKVN